MNTEKYLENPAEFVIQKQQKHDFCEMCDEPLYFALRDRHHEFSLPLSTLLECLKFAENEGVIPAIPTG
ncbi:hypothetical protein A1D23_08325 [Chelonobacter oris]|uniref:hypothetical protein n=1 Tax=Chelonobacter oris TaxID=505317 RepID=UPI00244953C0|nr:hypothetical protein [Chelonobacter oris]MDH3000188.1 hypothetical protein [Chelonobacter oris]